MSEAVIVSFGVRIKIKANSPRILKEALESLTLDWRFSASKAIHFQYHFYENCKSFNAENSTSVFSLLRGDSILIQTSNKKELFEVFKADSQLAVAENYRKKIFVHAGVVGFNGRAIIIPGRSFSGKSTLVEALVKAGAIYYSDEYAILNQVGTIEPYPKPISLRHNDSTVQTDFPIESVGGRQGIKPLNPGLILVTVYQPGASWNPVKISAGAAVLALFYNTVSARRHSAVALSVLSKTASHSITLTGIRGEAVETADSILNQLGS